MTNDVYTVADLEADLRAFRDERDWAKFHDPKSLILAMVGEVGELAELFQWIPADEAQAGFASGRRRERAAEEMADVLIYLVNLANVLGIDLLKSARDKVRDASARFPVEQHRGTAPVKD